MERGVLVLGDLLHLAIQFTGASLVNLAGFLQVAGAHSLEHAEDAGGIDIGRELRTVKRNLHVALGGQVVDLVGLHLINHFHNRHRVA